MNRHRHLSWLLPALALGAAQLSLPSAAQAREVIGDDAAEEEEEAPKPKKKKPAAPEEEGEPAPAPKAAPAAKDKPAAADGTAAPAPKKPKGKTEEEVEKEREAAEEAAIKKADDEARRKRESEAAKKKEAELRRSASKNEVGRANLEAARAARRFMREKDQVLFTVRLTPGAITQDKLTTLEMEIAHHLEEADPDFGDYKPMEGAAFIAVLTHTAAPPPKDPKAPPTPLAAPLTYAVHPMEDPGKYGFHVTVPAAGVWQLKVTGPGVKEDGKPVEVTIPLHVGVWPPPDFDAEEKNNAALSAGSGKSRVVE